VADLARAITVPVELDFLAISSYGDQQPASPLPARSPAAPPVSTGARTETPRGIRFLKDLDRPIEGKRVLVVEDIVDTGLTLHYILRSLALREPASLAVCTLLDRPYRRLADVPVRYRGFTVPDDFFVGYGFDYRQQYRHLPDIRFLKI
jgi:hypoxanthine phosphoribosyltransferase